MTPKRFSGSNAREPPVIATRETATVGHQNKPEYQPVYCGKSGNVSNFANIGRPCRVFTLYSPDFPPIEQVFAIHTPLLHVRAVRTVGALWQAAGTFDKNFSPDECADYFRNPGYFLPL